MNQFIVAIVDSKVPCAILCPIERTTAVNLQTTHRYEMTFLAPKPVFKKVDGSSVHVGACIWLLYNFGDEFHGKFNILSRRSVLAETMYQGSEVEEEEEEVQEEGEEKVEDDLVSCVTEND